VNFEGFPRVAVRPPWDGGWIFTRDKWEALDERRLPGPGASVWYPCKDHQSDEPDSGATLSITVPDTLWRWGMGGWWLCARRGGERWRRARDLCLDVVDPINNYDIIPISASSVNWHEDTPGEGQLDCNFWVLDYNLERRSHNSDRRIPCCIVSNTGWAYPFYEDGYKLVEAPHLGMEHQSAVAYGNKFENGYLGADLSGTGWGLKWDFIIVHESGHECLAIISRPMTSPICGCMKDSPIIRRPCTRPARMEWKPAMITASAPEEYPQ